MSLTVSITTPEGIVLAADSRQSYRNIAGVSRIGSDSATKIFPVKEKIAVTVAGPAFLVDPKDNNKNARGIGSFINDFINHMSREETVKTVSEKLKNYLEDIYKPDEQLKNLEKQLDDQITQLGGKVVKKETTPNGEALIADFTDSNGKPQKAVAEIMPISLIVSGYDEEKVGKPEIHSYVIHIPGPTKHARKYGDQNQYGANWTGQTDVITRIILGFDPRMNGLDFVEAARQNMGNDKVSQSLGSLEYNINWGAMTLHDAISFAKLMIETTSAVQRFSDGIKLRPGEMPGVGGPVDVAVILPHKGFYWHQMKELNLEKPEIG